MIWSKKSSGLPITIRTAYSNSITSRPSTVSTIVLDMDIRKNEPRILSKKDATLSNFLRSTSTTSTHSTLSTLTNTSTITAATTATATTTTVSNPVQNDEDEWIRGLDITVTIAGSWSTARSRVLQYFQQLAVITPYAHLSLQFISSKDSKKNFIAEFIRR